MTEGIGVQNGFSDFFYRAADGITLHARVYGVDVDARQPVVCLPGLTRNSRDFHDLAVFLSLERKVISFEYRGRGRSGADPDWTHYNIVTEAQDVTTGLDSLGIAAAHFIGTSRGGLIVHVLAAQRPDLLRAIVLNDIGPVIEPAGLAHISSYLNSSAKPATFEDAVRAQRSIHGQQFPALTPSDWSRMVEAIYRDENGTPVADFDPALLKTIQSLDPDKPLPMLWEQFDATAANPLLVIRGENSQLLSNWTIDEMRERHPGLDVIVVAGQGHPPMLETGDLPERISAFLTRADRA